MLSVVYDVSFMLSFKNKPFMLSVVMLSIFTLSVVMLSVFTLSVVMLSVFTLSVVKLSVVMLFCEPLFYYIKVERCVNSYLWLTSFPPHSLLPFPLT
jgi:hypothetical protein